MIWTSVVGYLGSTAWMYLDLTKFSWKQRCSATADPPPQPFPGVISYFAPRASYYHTHASPWPRRNPSS